MFLPFARRPRTIALRVLRIFDACAELLTYMYIPIMINTEQIQVQKYMYIITKIIESITYTRLPVVM